MSQNIPSTSGDASRSSNPATAHSADGAFLCARDGVLKAVSASWSQMLGWSESEAVGRRIQDFMPDDPINAALKSAFNFSYSGSPLPEVYPVTLQMKDGATLMGKAMVLFLPDGVRGALIRSTARHRLEDEWILMQHLPQQLNLCRNTRDVCETVAREAWLLFKHDALAINYIDMQTMQAFTLYEEDTPEGAEHPVAFWPLPDEHNKPSPVAKYTGLETPTLINREGAESDPDLVAFGTGRLSMSLMFSPIRLEGQVVGQLTIQSYTRNKYSDTDLALLESFGDQCGAALARTRAAEALFRSESIFRKVIERADGVPYKLDLETHRYEYIGPKAVALLGIPPEQINHQRLVEIVKEVHVADPAWEGDDQAYIKAFREGQISQYIAELRVVTPQGEEKWVSDTAVPMRDPVSGRVTASLGILQDITMRVKSEKRLRRSEATKSALLHAIPDMMLIVDRRGQILEYMPARNFSLTGETAGSLTGLPLPAILPELGHFLSPEFCDLVLREQVMRLHELQLTFPEGRLDVEARAIPHQADTLLLILRDITERKEAERERQALQRLSQRLTGSLSTHTISRILAEESAMLFHHDAFSIMQIDKDRQIIRDLYLEDTPLGHTQPQSMPTRPPKALNMDDSAHTKARLINRDAPPAEPVNRPFGDVRRMSMSIMLAPIMWENKQVGLISVQSYQPYRYNDRHLELLTAFASQCGAALVRSEAEERLHRTAYYDSLTGLPNRTLLLEVLTDTMQESRQRKDYTLFLFFIDVDRFKNINDSLGYQIGDELLLVIARRLVGVLGELDMVARIGGDEFIVVTHMPNEAENVEMLCQLIEKEINRPIRIHSHDLLVSACVGIAPCTAKYESADKLLHDAEVAMFLAKKQGRGCHAFFDQFVHEKTLESIRLESDLASAVRRGELELHYQPLVNLKSGQVIGLEALVRWRHPTHGFVMPNSFISIAEDTGLIYALGEWVASEACETMSHWRLREPEFRGMSISINVSPRQFSHPGFPLMVERVLSESGLPAEALNVEITESALLEDKDKMAGLFHTLKTMGVNLHLDDFGTGYCSLSYLHQYPIDALKIDRSFISDIHTNQDKLQITRSIMALAEMLDLMVIAEGVELDAQRSLLISLGCTFAQGMLLCEPRPRAEVEKFVIAHHSSAGPV